MKKTKNLYAVLLAGILLFSGCAHSATDETDAIETTETILETESPEPIPPKHKISIDEVESLLAANGLQTNIDEEDPTAVRHGGQQMRLCHTDRGTYAICAKGFVDGVFYVAKIAPDNTVTLLHTGEFEQDGSVPIDIGQDNNGDIVVSSSTSTTLFIYIFDKETDAVTEYSMPYVFGSVEFSYPGYGQTMFDFANRKIYKFFCGGLGTGNYELEWFTFDLETKTWAEKSICQSLEGIGRHCYIFPFPDGNGGAYIVGERDILISTVGDQLQHDGSTTYLWDELKLFHIPDLTTGENITYTTVFEAQTERGAEGIWSDMGINQHGGAFVDKNGYLHITYCHNLYNLSGEPREFDNNVYYYHAIYDGMECLYNEVIAELPVEVHPYSLPKICQNADGELYMLVSQKSSRPLVVQIFKAVDELGKTWQLEDTKTFADGIKAPSFSISEARSGSTQDNIISCFFYYSKDQTACVFNISLEDYSITELVDLLEGYDLPVDERLDNRAHNTAHQTKLIHTEDATYAAFVYNYDSDSDLENYHIVKIDKDNQVTILLSDSYASTQDRYMTMWRVADGTIYVCPPTGGNMYTIDPATDAVQQLKINKIPTKNLGFMVPNQRDFVTNPETGEMYVLSTLLEKPLSLNKYSYDPEKLLHDKTGIKYDFDSTLVGSYSHFYTLSDGANGAYIVATRSIAKGELETLTYRGHTLSIDDALTLFYIPDLANTETVQCIDIQLPDDAAGNEGIWSVVNCADNGDVYLDSTGKLHVLYTMYNFDFDDLDNRGNSAPIANTLKHYHAIYDGATLISNEELGIAGLTKDSSVRMAETTDGTLYLLICNLNEAGAKIDVYFETENGWALTQTKTLGEFTAESFSISSPRGGSVQDNVIDCIIYAADNDVYYTSVIFE